eukprot:99917-Chlamydomonas_euryale.AAC.3
MKVRDARAAIEEHEAERAMQSEVVAREAVRVAEQDGIVFIDEIDKVCWGGSGGRGKLGERVCDCVWGGGGGGAREWSGRSTGGARSGALCSLPKPTMCTCVGCS